MEQSAVTPFELPADIIALIPMRNVVLFPHVVMPVTVGRARSIASIQYVLQSKTPIGIVLQKDPAIEEPGLDVLYPVGTLANVVRHITSEDGTHHAICLGIERFRIKELVEGYPFIAARIQRIPETIPDTTQVEALTLQLRERAMEILSLLPGVPAELAHALQATRSPSDLADITASLLDTEVAEKQALLETIDIEERLHKVLQILARRIEVLRLSQEIGERTKEQMEDRERKFLLREQLKAIQKELGEEGENEQEVAKLDEAITAAGMPEDIEQQTRKELQRLQRMPAASSEFSMLHTYLEWITELPWKLPEETPINLDAARSILEADHFGLERIKQRIIEFLAVQKLKPQGRAPILCFVGPPGVGKTSLGQSIARALQRPFVRVSLGGIHDEAEMRGHRRTYVGAMPGNIVQNLRKAGARNCVMMLDEIDKMTASAHGDPSAALLEILDPEQNATFRDNYLGVPFDLSRVVFIATANVIDQVSPPVRDRMEIIDLPGYTPEEKLQIAQRYLVQRQSEANGLQLDQCILLPEALQSIIANYTREAGVRQFEREIGRIMRHAALKIAQGEQQQVRIDANNLMDILGPEKYEHELALRTSLSGVATGLAWTPAGGDILFIEATRVSGSGRLILTGQLGDVMKESAQAALTLVKARASDLNIAASMFDGIDVHLHVPAGAIPKDGPSAGVAMFTALASLFTNQLVRHDVAMTGEISLRGLVLPVGGIKEKILAAQRAGIQTVLLPARNRKDLHDVPEAIRTTMQFVFLETADDAIRAALDVSINASDNNDQESS
ncbi:MULTISPECIES: endopeptidase La [Nitrosomonas]|uniref:Lon protease n=2 Tax=Nitrosomonas eutropha TaxID=916 RepID=A0ABX5MBY6_9PROT|nr:MULTISPECIES: endopeptidase La [Nitrosomonas]ABI59230.1 ATP-dependent protease La [Nitrosomonas eutropha C91]MXS79285.1 endopeptidase La [Nitrosomonas sp. GH22]PXV83406.1 ATP-dependent Lon protease [Nitrosomonas eutropha]SDW63102.1 ATP-dependent Lon protease [Nitrosomonas eutropha]SEI61401.1 ATP-dependent Lon protease [Nitrosomonas eutropha]